MLYRDREWIIHATADQFRADPTVRAIADSLGILLPTAQLLVSRGCQTPDEARRFLFKQTEMFHDPFDLMDMD